MKLLRKRWMCIALALCCVLALSASVFACAEGNAGVSDNPSIDPSATPTAQENTSQTNDAKIALTIESDDPANLGDIKLVVKGEPEKEIELKLYAYDSLDTAIKPEPTIKHYTLDGNGELNIKQKDKLLEKGRWYEITARYTDSEQVDGSVIFYYDQEAPIIDKLPESVNQTDIISGTVSEKATVYLYDAAHNEKAKHEVSEWEGGEFKFELSLEAGEYTVEAVDSCGWISAGKKIVPQLDFSTQESDDTSNSSPEPAPSKENDEIGKLAFVLALLLLVLVSCIAVVVALGRRIRFLQEMKMDDQNESSLTVRRKQNG